MARAVVQGNFRSTAKRITRLSGDGSWNLETNGVSGFPQQRQYALVVSKTLTVIAPKWG